MVCRVDVGREGGGLFGSAEAALEASRLSRCRVRCGVAVRAVSGWMDGWV